MCPRVILIDHGKILADGDSKTICNRFYDINDKKIAENARINRGHRLQTTGEVEVLELYAL